MLGRNPITVNNFDALFNCIPPGRASNLIKAPGLKGAMPCLWKGPPDFCCSGVSVLVLLLSTQLISSTELNLDLYIYIC